MPTKKSRLIKAEVGEIVENELRKRYSWGKDDKLPNKLLRAIQDSGTAMSCVDALQSFISADGFVDERTKAFMVNSNQNADDLLSEISPSSAIFEGFALRVLYRLDGTPGSVFRVQLKKIRPLSDGSFRYNEKMGEAGYKESEDVILKPYNPKVSVQDRLSIIQNDLKSCGKQKGEILLAYQPKEINNGDILPMPSCNSALEDIKSDAALQRQENRNIVKGFKASTIIFMPGEVDDKTVNQESGKTDRQELDELLGDFCTEDAASVALIENKGGKEGAPEIVPYPVKDVIDGVDRARTRVPRAVCRAFSVPPVLVGLEEATVLGNMQAIYNSLKMFVLKIKTRKKLIQRTLARIWPDIDWTISELNISDYLPKEVLEKLTEKELRAIGGYSERATNIDEESQKTINAIASLPEAIANRVLATMSDEEVRSLVNIKKK